MFIWSQKTSWHSRHVFAFAPTARRHPAAPWRGRATKWENAGMRASPATLDVERILATMCVDPDKVDIGSPSHMPNPHTTTQPTYIDSLGGCPSQHCNLDLHDNYDGSNNTSPLANNTPTLNASGFAIATSTTMIDLRANTCIGWSPDFVGVASRGLVPPRTQRARRRPRASATPPTLPPVAQLD